MTDNMIAYKFFWRDEIGKEHFVGVLPERRKNPERITEDSILNWAREVMGINSEVSNIYFVQVKI